MKEESSDPDQNVLSDSAVTLELFRKWRTPRVGHGNPEKMNNPVWEWLIRSKLSAYLAALDFPELPAAEVGPGWCFDRFGQSETRLSDGRTVLIAGEHEDWYDPDFYIYNDVVIQHPNGEIDIYGYPTKVFPPTDFHSATLVENQIILIGTLGYSNQRQPEFTQILSLDLATMSISSVKSSGVAPGWIHDHEAFLEEGKASILIRGGKIVPGAKNASLVKNIDDWRLNLADWRWERVTK